MDDPMRAALLAGVPGKKEGPPDDLVGTILLLASQAGDWLYNLALLAFVVPSPLGEGITRFRLAAVPIAVLALSLRRWRPVSLAIVFLAVASVWIGLTLSYEFPTLPPSSMIIGAAVGIYAVAFVATAARWSVPQLLSKRPAEP